MKIIKNDFEINETAQNELILIKRINHENIIRYFDNFEDKFNGMNYLCIICEYCPVLNKTLSLSHSFRIFTELYL